MSEFVQGVAEWGAGGLELLGLGVIVLLALYALISAAVQLARRVEGGQLFRQTRHRLGRGILLGLELLVAADIVHTVAVDLTFTSLGVLAIIVAIRTFLSFTLEVELSGRWPWQGRQEQEQAER